MSRPNPIQYAERLYAAIRAANFSPISFLTFGNAVKDGLELRRMPRIAAEPFMRVVGEMLELEQASADEEIIEAEAIAQATSSPLADEPHAGAAAERPVPGDEPPSQNKERVIDDSRPVAVPHASKADVGRR